jgi:hypothetical protein
MNDPKKTLGYSSLPNARNAELDAERDRREQVENYNVAWASRPCEELKK